MNLKASNFVKAFNPNSEVFPETYNATDEEIVQRIKYTAGYTNTVSIANFSELDYLQDLLQLNRFDVQATMKKLMLPCTKLLFRCRWEGVIMDCKELFSVSETYQGNRTTYEFKVHTLLNRVYYRSFFSIRSWMKSETLDNILILKYRLLLFL